jgi:hypothetical protein
MRWICIYCKTIMDKTNFTDFIKQSDNDKNSNQEAKVRVSSDHYASDYTHQDEKLGTAMCGVVTRPLGSSHSS